MSRTIEDALKALESFRSLPANWDSYGGLPVSPEAIRIARSILEHPDSVNVPNVVATSAGGVMLDYDEVGGIHQEVEITPAGDVEVFTILKGLDGPSLHFVIPGVKR